MTSMMTARRGVMAKPTAGFTPASVSNLAAWWKADAITGLADADPVVSWPDSSGNSRSLANATSSKRPTYRTSGRNGKPTVRFDGVDDFLDSTSFALAQPMTIILAFTPGTFPSGTVMFDTATSADGSVGFYHDTAVGSPWKIDAGATITTSTVSAQNVPEVDSVTFNGASSYFASGGVAQSAAAGGSNGMSAGIRLGANRVQTPSYFFLGDLHEVAVYSRALTTTERHNVEAYLGTKYAITVT